MPKELNGYISCIELIMNSNRIKLSNLVSDTFFHFSFLFFKCNFHLGEGGERMVVLQTFLNMPLQVLNSNSEVPLSLDFRLKALTGSIMRNRGKI